MECNKDEALRAKALAEQRMVNNDFEGARRIALKAKQLFPEIDNISQLVTVCDIHCSAQKKIYGAEKDLYGILQVEKVADEATIRKQYRKLALVLHPDKNKFPGAEAAFKFVGEANMVLSDTGKRSVYDIKCRDPARASVTKLQNRQGNQSSYMAQNKFKNVSTSQFNGMNHQHRQSESKPNDRLSFWTYCPFCNVKYEYYREFINRPLRCQHCSKLFIAHDIGVQGAAMGPHFVHKKMKNANVKSSQAQSTVSQQKDVRRREPVKINIQKDGMHHEVGGCSRSRIEQEGVLKPKVNVQKPMETGTSKDMNKKRGRKMVVEFSESSSDVEDSTFGGVDNGSGGDSVNQRRSSQRKQQIPSQEYAADELSPQKRSRLGKKEKVSVCQDKPCNTADVGKDVSKQKARECADVSMPNGINKKKDIVNGEEDVPLNDHLGDSDPELVDCPDSEFTNFDKDKEEHCFAVDQIWACYDSVDGMPRFYAQVRKIFKSEFKLRITWLEPEPENDSEIKWAEAGLPVACGKFVLGETEEMKDRLCFSHQMTYKKGGGRSSYVIYPQKGEIWALYKDWDIKWSLDPTSHQKYKFDIVEVLSVHEDGIYVAFLLKVKQFVSVFQKKILAGLATHKIPSNEQFRFSHRIKSVTLTGTERAGVPTGSFELDTASLPLGDYNYHNEVSTEPENYSGQTSQSHKEKVKPSSRLSRTPKKHMNGPDIEMLNLRRSPRGLGDQSKGGVTDKVNDGQSSQSREEKVKPVTCLSNTSKKLIGVDMLNLRRSPRGVMRGDQCNGTIDEVNDGRSPFRRGGDRDPISNKFAKSTRISSPSACRKMIGHDFSSDKHIWKFQVGQIWAFWENDNGIRQCYAQIKQIESNPIRLRVSLLKICNISSNCTIRHNACGLFKVTSGRTKMLTLDSFSHNVIAEARGKDTFSIYPREQQIWALYKTSDLKVGECDIVEVLEADESSIKVLSLTCVPGNKFVFKAPRIQRSTGKTNVIPRLELSRFSHQIPAFRFTEEKDGCLRGCWELDPAAFTGPPLLGSN